MTTAEKITVTVHVCEAVAVVIFMALAAVKFNTLGNHLDASQDKAATATIDTMTDIKAKGDAFLLAGTALLKSVTETSDAVRSEVKPTAQSIQSAANSASGMAQQASATMKTAQTAIAGLTPLEKAITAETEALRTSTLSTNALIHDVHRKLNANAVYAHNILVSASGILKNGNGIMSDAHKVSDRMTTDYLRPVPWWKWPFKRIGETWDMGAAVARHTP